MPTLGRNCITKCEFNVNLTGILAKQHIGSNNYMSTLGRNCITKFEFNDNLTGILAKQHIGSREERQRMLAAELDRKGGRSK